MNYLRFFLGTPRRFLATSTVLVITFGFFFPQVVASAAGNLLGAIVVAVEPLMAPLLTIAIMIAITFWLLKKVIGGGKKKKR